MRGSEEIPYKLLMYLLDLPDKHGYVPVDDNERPRVRLMKYLYYDDSQPLSKALPTPAQKLSLLFDPQNPDLNTDELREKHPKDYRLFWQKLVEPSQLNAASTLKCYIGRIQETKRNFTTIGIRFDIFVNMNLETNTKTIAYQRGYDIEQCLREALNGVNMAGIGTISFSRLDHFDNGSYVIYDTSTNIGRSLHCSILWTDGGGEDDFCHGICI